jgi:hypothetical protein
MTELMWKNEEDRLQIIKNLADKFNSGLEGCFTVNLAAILQDYLPWMISRVEKLEKQLESKMSKDFCPKSDDGKHLFDDFFDTVDMRPTGNLLVCIRAKCTKCGYKE